MKQNLLFNQASALGKRLAIVLTMLLIVGIGQAWGATAEFAPTNFSGQGTSGTGSKISATVNGVTFACDKGYGTTPFRCYSGSTITISSSNTITAISFTFSENKYTGGLETSYTNLSTTSWEKKLSSQARITKCVVTYKEASADPYTVTFHTTATAETELTEESAGDGVTPPEMEEICGDWEFMGWSKSFSNSETSTTELELVTLDEGIYYPTADVDLYPVYTKIEGGGGSTTTTFTFASIASAKNWSNGNAYTPVEISPITITANGGGNNAKYYTSDQTWRMYSGGSLTITTSIGNITNVSSNPSCTFTMTNGTATCTFSATTKFKSITVTSGGGSTTYYYSYPQCTTQTVLSLIPQPAYRHSVKNLLFCKFHHINMSKITWLVCAFACKQLTNIVSNGQPNDPRPRFCYYIIFYIKFALFCQNIWSVRFFVVPLQP